MAEIPRLQESEPVLQPQGVVSGAEGFKEFAQTLGSLSEKAVKHVETIEEEKSDAMFTSSVADIEKLKTQAYVRMTEDPSSAKRVAEDMKASLDAIEKNAFVNKADRNRLKKYTVSQLGEVERKAATTDVDLRLRMTAMHFYEDWNDEQVAYFNANLKDHNQAEILKDKMISKLNNMVAIGALTPHQGASLLRGLSSNVQAASDLYTAANEETIPEHLNALLSDPLHNNDPNIAHVVHPDTQFLMDHYRLNYDKNMAISQVMSGTLPNPQNWINLTEKEQHEILEAKHGYQAAQGIIKTVRGGLPTVEKAAQLLTERGDNLSTRDRYTRDSLNQYINDIKNGNFNGALNTTGIGKLIDQNYLMQQQAINNGAGGALDKARQTIELKDKTVNDRVAAGHALGIPDSKIKPIDQADVVVAQSTFDNVGADPDALINLQGQYSPANNGYFMRSMQTPAQQMAMYVTYNSGDQVSSAEKRDYIYAQQGRDYKHDNPDTADLDNKKLRLLVETQLQPVIRTINQTYPPSEAQQYRDGIINNTMNYAKFLAGKNINIDDKSANAFKRIYHWTHTPSLSDFAMQASNFTAKAFTQKSSTNWVVNEKSIPKGLSNSDLDHLANYATHEAYKHLSAGRTEQEAQEAASRNPLTMRISDTHQVEAVDGFGNVYWSMPYTSDMLTHAYHMNEERAKEEIEKKKARSAKGKEITKKIVEKAPPTIFTPTLSEAAEKGFEQ